MSALGGSIGRMEPLTVREHMALTLATTRYKYAAVRDGRVRDELGWGATALWARVNALLDDPRAEVARPVEVRRLRRLREARRAVRTAS